METLELTRIESVKGTMPCGLGSVVRYSIDITSKPEFVEYFGELSVKQAMMLDINLLAGQGIEQGEFISSAMILDDDYEVVMVAVGGTYSIEPAYDLFHRVTRWGYNFASGEALTREDFREAYGEESGDRFYEKWVSLDRGIEPMIAHLADDTGNGQTFLGMVMKRVRQYEKRLRGIQ